MLMKKLESNLNIVTVLLGVIIGVLLTNLVIKILPEKKFDGDYERWRKLNLILQEVQKNYVDTIDMKGMTDAAITAALAKATKVIVKTPHEAVGIPTKEANAEGKYVVDFEKAAAAIDSWANLILETQATGNFEFARKYAAENAEISEGLAADVAKVNEAGIPRDIVFEFNW